MTLSGIDETLQAALDCVCTALDDAGRPVCVCSSTIGQPMIATCCACDGSGEGEGSLWGAFQTLLRIDRRTLTQAAPRRGCAGALWGARYQLTLARCFPTIDERGRLPKPARQAAVAERLHADAALIARALTCCNELEDPVVEQVSVDTDPQGGCSFLRVTFLAPVTISANANALAEARDTMPA